MKKKLEAVYSTLLNARDEIGILFCENYPYTDFEDEDLCKMFYELNKMAIEIRNKLIIERNKTMVPEQSGLEIENIEVVAY